MAKTTQEKLKRARSWLTGRKWKVDKHRLVASVGYEALTVKLSLSEEHDGLPREFLEAAVKAIYTDEAGVENAALQIVEGADYGGTWILREAGIEREETGGQPPTDNRLALWKKYVRRTAVNPQAAVMEDNCTFLVSYTFYLGVLALPAVPEGSSGITYRLTSSNYDREDGVWDCILERKEQKTTTTGVMVIEDDAFKTVQQQGFYGVRTGNLDEDGQAVALWPVNDDVQGTLVETVFVQKNENCTTDVIQKRTVAKAETGEVRRERTIFGDTVTITLRNQAVAVEAFVEVADGAVTARTAERNADGTFDNTETVKTAIPGTAEVRRERTVFSDTVTITLRNQAAAVDAFVEVAGGAVTARGSKRNEDGTWDNTETVKTAIPAEAEVRRERTVFGETVTITLRNQAEAVNAFVEVAGGAVTTRGSMRNEDGTFDNTETVKTAIPGTAEMRRERTVFSDTVTITLRNQAAAVDAFVEVAGGAVTARGSKRNEDGTYDNTETVRTGIPAEAEVRRERTAFGDTVTITLRNQAAAVNAFAEVFVTGILTARGSKRNEDGTYDNTETVKTATAAEAEVRRERTAFGDTVTVTLRNQTAAVNAFVEVAGGIVTVRGSVLNADKTYDNTETVKTAIPAEADVERERTQFADTVTITLRNQAAAVDAFAEAAGGIIVRRRAKLNEDKTWDNTETTATEIERLAAVTRTVKTIWGKRETVQDRSAEAAGTFAEGETGTQENKLTPGGRFDREKLTETLDETVDETGVETREEKGGGYLESYTERRAVVSAKAGADKTGLDADGKVYTVTYDTDELTGILRKTVRARTAAAGVTTVLLDKTVTHRVSASVLYGRVMEHTKMVLYTNVDISVWQAELSAFVGSHAGFIVAWAGATWNFNYKHDVAVGLRPNDFGKWDGVLTMKAEAEQGFMQETEV